MLRVKQKDFAKEHGGGVFSNPIPIGVGGEISYRISVNLQLSGPQAMGGCAIPCISARAAINIA